MDTETEQALRRENEKLHKQLADAYRYDRLTGMLSKDAFYAEVTEALKVHAAEPRSIVCFDIRRFKLVNDLHGMAYGDQVLCAFSEALRAAYAHKDGALVARLNADQFAAFVPTASNDEIEAVIRSICAACPDDYDILANAGVYHIGDGALSVGLMCDRAMLALRAVKGDYFACVAEYNPGLRDELVVERAVQEGIEVALAADQIEPFFQPKCNIRTGKVVGAEALARWRHPERGIVPPSEFVPLLERSGFIRALDMRIWEKTAAWLAELIAAGIEPVPVSVNVSRADIDGMDVCATLTDIVDRYGIDSSLFEVEITEGAYVDRRDQIIEASDALMNGGFTVLMDDFGSGYSSLNMLKDINVNVLKIDMQFLDRSDRRSRDIMESVVHMARWLNLPVIAEGVETDEQVEFLLDVGCVFAQGFRFYRPMDAEAFTALITDGSEVEYGGMVERIAADSSKVFDFKDLLHEDVVSDRMLSSILGAVALYSLEGDDLRIMRGNPAYRRLTGWPTGDADSDSDNVMGVVYPDDAHLLLEAAKRARNAHDDNGVQFVARRMTEGSVQWIEMRLFHLYTSGSVDVLYGCLSNVTERMADTEALRMSEQRFEIAMESTGLVVFELDVATRTARYSASSQRAFGLNTAVIDAPEGFIEQGTVDEVSIDDFCDAFEAIYRGEERVSVVARSRMADGAAVWNRLTLLAVKGAENEPAKAVGLVENVTREKEMELLLGSSVFDRLDDDQQHELVDLIGDEAVFGVIGRYLEPDFPLYFASIEFISMLGYTSYADYLAHTGGLTYGSIVSDDVARIAPRMLARRIGEEFTEHYDLICKDGAMKSIKERGHIVQASDGRRATLGICSLVRDGA